MRRVSSAPRMWYDTVVQELKNLNGKVSSYANAMILWHDTDGELEGILVSHVDDFVFCGSDKWHCEVMASLKQKFEISSYSPGSFKYVGLNVLQTDESIFVDQYHYVQELKPIMLVPERRSNLDDNIKLEETS